MDCDEKCLVGPGIFWWWNDTPTRSAIDESVAAFASRGFRYAYVHAMPASFRPVDFFAGMELDYLSDAFFELVAYTCDALKRHGMHLWLYDEGGWPSGMGGGQVVEADKSYGVWTLHRQGDRYEPRQWHDQISYPDLMNADATDCFIRTTHERYRKVLGHEFGRTVRGIFTDEPRLLGRVGTDAIPWSPVVPAAYERDHGQPLADVLPLLFTEADNSGAQAVQRRYVHTISTLVANHYYKRIHNWCSTHQLLFEGHHSGENEFSTHGQYFGDYLQQARHYHVPGVDTIWRQIFPGVSSGNFATLASSAAWLAGNKLACSESFAVYGAGLTLAQMKWVLGCQLVRGINRLGYMANLLSTFQDRRFSAAQDLSPRSPTWKEMDLLNGFVQRAAEFTCRGTVRPTVAVLYRTELVAPAKAAEFDALHDALCDKLHDQWVPFIFAPADELERMDDLAAVVIHADGPISHAERQCLYRAALRGVTILHVKNENDIADLDATRWSPVAGDQQASGVRLQFRYDNGWAGVLAFNESAEVRRVRFNWRGKSPGKWVECELDQSRIGWIDPPASGDAMDIVLHPGEMRAFESIPSTALPERWVKSHTVAVDSQWTVAEQERYRIEDDVSIVTVSSAERTTALADDAVQDRDFSGSLVYRTVIDMDALDDAARYTLLFDEVYYACEVTVNGQSAGRRAWGPYRFDVTGKLMAGRNAIAVRVTNTLANQWLKAGAPLRKNMYVERAIPFMQESLHAGLSGAVVLERWKRGDQ